MASSSNMPATRPRWSNTWLRYEGCSGMTISSEGEPLVKDLQRNTKITQIAKRGAERRIKSHDQTVRRHQQSWRQHIHHRRRTYGHKQRTLDIQGEVQSAVNSCKPTDARQGCEYRA